MDHQILMLYQFEQLYCLTHILIKYIIKHELLLTTKA